MDKFTMHAFEVVVPDSAETRSGVDQPAACFRHALLSRAVTGWTESRTRGWWKGEPDGESTTFLILAQTRLAPLGLIASAARQAMPDEDAIQVSYLGTREVWEA